MRPGVTRVYSGYMDTREGTPTMTTTTLCWVEHPAATHSDGRSILCHLPQGHEGSHEDGSLKNVTGEILAWDVPDDLCQNPGHYGHRFAVAGDCMSWMTPSNPANDREAAIRQFQSWADEQADHQPREHSVPCARCRRGTWNRSAVCDRCELDDAMAVRP